MMAMAGRLCKPSPTRRRVLQVAGALAALYGLYAFFHRSISTYLFLQSQFVFFDFEEPLIFFFLDYLAAMGLFVWIGHQLAKAMLALQKRSAQQ